jgi:hypothetical protein
VKTDKKMGFTPIMLPSVCLCAKEKGEEARIISLSWKRKKRVVVHYTEKYGPLLLICFFILQQ